MIHTCTPCPPNNRLERPADAARSACALCLMGIDHLTRQEILKRYTNPLAWLAGLDFSAFVVPQSCW